MVDLFQSVFAPPRDMILLVLAAWLGSLLAEGQAGRHQIGKEPLNSLIFYMLLAFVFAGRITDALANFSAYAASPLDLFSPHPHQFDLAGGLAGALLAFLIFTRRLGLPRLNMLDALVPFFATLAVGSGLRHLAAGTAYGQPTQVPWAVVVGGTLIHPSQAYETIASLLILALVWLPDRLAPGIQFLLFTSLTAGVRLFLEAFRGDSDLLPGGFRTAQVGAFLILAASLVFIEALLVCRSHLKNGFVER